MFQIIYYIVNAIQPFLVPICFVSAWALVILVGWSMWITARDSVKIATQMHQIPCSGCQYFTDDYRLKCTVNPSIANTEEAIQCMDYQPKTNPMLY
ncbi:MAG: hypothetical protein HC836_25115 [Richelia sp. RM2_1_2]|nr:hypothetical protein [Richelia sp. SM1_7_0]NJN10366.1 hypothetical protein [Richelia sp. RM1_1_1]NJO31322.1 hypothetical protein [Richelia sp. SL_2_1]NJO61412.1 hypothetical protein [Richelia sp. RM2_1_2]